MNQQQISDLINRLLDTGEILATKAYEIALKQTISEAWVDVFMAILFLVLFIYLAISIQKRYKETGDVDGVIAFSYIIDAMFLAVFVSNFVGAFQKFYNPAWYAVKLLLNTFLK